MKKKTPKLILVVFALALASLLLTSSAQGLPEPAGPAVADNGDEIKTQGDLPGSWEVLYPSPITTSELNSVSMVSATDGWAVGDDGTILHYDGATWTEVESPTTRDLRSINMVSATDGWVAGGTEWCSFMQCGWDAILLRYDGTAWQEEFTAQRYMLHSISMVSATDGWAVGSHGTILHYDGTAWTEVESPTTEWLTSVDMISATDGWIVGDGGTILHYDGTAWTTVENPATGKLTSVDMVSPTQSWAAGLGYEGGYWVCILLHHDGTAWTVVESPTAHTLYSVDIVSATEGWAVGAHGTILHYDGTAWTRVGEGPTDAPLHSVDMVSATDGWAVGYYGTILHYDGTAWSKVESPTTARLYSVDMVSATDGWAVGTGGTILHYDDTAWTVAESPTTATLYSVDMISATDGWAVGGVGWDLPVILHYDGTTWTKVESPVTEGKLRSVDMVSATDGWAVGALWYAFFCDVNILHYDGTTWTEVESPATAMPDSVSMASATDGWVVGLYGTILHYDGTTWTEVESQTTEWLTSVDTVSATDGWAVGDTILHYDGTAWTEVESLTAEMLYSVDMVSATDGWIVGSNGTILHYVMPPPDLSPSTKAVDQETSTSRNTLTYTITLHNAGPGDAIGALVTDTLPTLTTYVPGSLSATGGCYSHADGVITWTGNVPVGLPVTITFQAAVDPTLTHSDTITNTAFINDGRGSVLTRSATTFIEPVGFLLSVRPEVVLSTPGDAVRGKAQLSSMGSFDAPVTLSLSGLPTDAEAAFIPNPVIPPAYATLTITTTPTTSLGTYPLTVTASDGVITRTADISLMVVSQVHSTYLPLISRDYSGLFRLTHHSALSSWLTAGARKALVRH